MRTMVCADWVGMGVVNLFVAGDFAIDFRIVVGKMIGQWIVSRSDCAVELDSETWSESVVDRRVPPVDRRPQIKSVQPSLAANPRVTSIKPEDYPSCSHLSGYLPPSTSDQGCAH